jgi:hypothetical protein
MTDGAQHNECPGCGRRIRLAADACSRYPACANPDGATRKHEALVSEVDDALGNYQEDAGGG